MTDPTEHSRKYLEELNKSCEPFRERASEYENRAIQFASNALRAMTYLNGGGLVAIPTVVALFKADPQSARHQLILTAVGFVAGLICIVAAQACGFFTLARNAEAQALLEEEVKTTLHSYYFPGLAELQVQKFRQVVQTPQHKKVRSNQWRRAALVWFWLSLVCFIAGCWFGVQAVR